MDLSTLGSGMPFGSSPSRADPSSSSSSAEAAGASTAGGAGTGIAAPALAPLDPAMSIAEAKRLLAFDAERERMFGTDGNKLSDPVDDHLLAREQAFDEAK